MTSNIANSHPEPEPVNKWLGFWELMRFHKPIGTWLLAAPTAWALVLASDGWPRADLLIIFTLGVIVMRAAGCVANDLADRKLDGFVERTRYRPLITGAVSTREALGLLLFLLVVALILVLMTNRLTVVLSFFGAGLAMVYPFMKRWTHLPQFVLGAAFSWSIPMAFAAATNSLPVGLWWLFAANLLWTVVYDTQYAMVDIDDDLAIGIKSTAILFGQMDRRLIGLMQLIALECFVMTGVSFQLGLAYFVAIAGVGMMFLWHQWLIRERDKVNCFKAFNQSKWIGLIVLTGIVGQFAA